MGELHSIGEETIRHWEAADQIPRTTRLPTSAGDALGWLSAGLPRRPPDDARARVLRRPTQTVRLDLGGRCPRRRSKRHREHLGSSRREAERLQVEIIAQRNRQLRGLSPGDQDMKLNRIARKYLADKRLRVSEMHHRNVEPTLARILPTLPVQTVRLLLPLHVIRYRTQLMERRASNRTVNVHLQALQGMLCWGVRMALIAANPLAGVGRHLDGPKHQRYRRRALSDQDIERLLAAAAAEDKELTARRFVPQAPLWRWLLETAGSYSEVVRAAWADFKEHEVPLTFAAQNTKSEPTRVIPLFPHFSSRLARLRDKRAVALRRVPQASDPIFQTPRSCAWPWPSININRVPTRLRKAAVIEKLDAHGRKLDVHSLRHSFISRLARTGVGLVQAQRLAEHSTTVLTRRMYSHVELETLRSAISCIES